MHRLRSIAVYLALVALVMRALVPVGWMPATHAASSSTLVPCPMMDGIHGTATPQQNEEPQHPAKHQLPDSHEGSICPFATSVQPVRMIEPHRIEINPPRFASFAAAASGLWASWDHVPRAPPDIA